jgi:hypothetical protein
VTGRRIGIGAVLAIFYRVNSFGQNSDDVVEFGDSLFNSFRRQQMVAAFITPETFTGFTAGNFQMLW